MPSKPPRGLSPTVRRVSRVLLALATAATLLAVRAPVASAERGGARTDENRSTEPTGSTLAHPAQSLPTDGDLELEVRSEIPTETPYYEARFQVMRPDGGLMLQKTEILHDLEPGRVTVRFERELASLGLRPAAYPVRVRVRLGDDSGLRDEQTIEGRVFVYDPERRPVPVALVVRLSASPALDPEGRFVTDPAVYSADRDAALALAEQAPLQRERFSLAIPPHVLDQWRRAGGGYSKVGPDGVEDVPAEDPTALACLRALKAVARLAALEPVELLDVPYADPDLQGLDAAGMAADLERHYSRGVPTYLASLDQTPSAATILSGGAVPASAIPPIARRGIRFAVVSRDSLAGSRVSGGAHRVRESTLTVLVSEAEVGSRLSENAATALDRLFEAYVDGTNPDPVTTVMEIGAGRRGGVADVIEAMSALGGAPWIETVTVSEAAGRTAVRDVRLTDRARDRSAPADYWPAAERARSYASALSSAAGERDGDAEAAWYLTLMSQSRAWAGADGSWGLADRGRAYSGAAQRRAGEVLERVVLQVEDVTLAGQSGEIPVNVSNRTRRPMNLTLRISPRGLDTPEGSRVVELQPGDNYVTVPVDLRSALSGTVDIGLYADTLRIENESIVVRASYLDRIALVGAVAAILVGMLFFIKRRVDTADAANIGRNGRRDA